MLPNTIPESHFDYNLIQHYTTEHGFDRFLQITKENPIKASALYNIILKQITNGFLFFPLSDKEIDDFYNQIPIKPKKKESIS